MPKKVIAVDIDEVLVPHNAPLADLHNRLFGSNHTIDDYHDDWPSLWGVDRDEAEKRARIWWDSKEWKNRHKHPIQGSAGVLERLQKSYELVVITGRSKNTAKFTEKWLDEYFPSIFKKAHFVGIWEEGLGRNKAEVCRTAGVNYMIEDSLEQSFACAKAGVKVLLFGNYNWNQYYGSDANITKVNSWADVEKYFDGQAS